MNRKISVSPSNGSINQQSLKVKPIRTVSMTFNVKSMIFIFIQMMMLIGSVKYSMIPNEMKEIFIQYWIMLSISLTRLTKTRSKKISDPKFSHTSECMGIYPRSSTSVTLNLRRPLSSLSISIRSYRNVRRTDLTYQTRLIWIL